MSKYDVRERNATLDEVIKKVSDLQMPMRMKLDLLDEIKKMKTAMCPHGIDSDQWCFRVRLRPLVTQPEGPFT